MKKIIIIIAVIVAASIAWNYAQKQETATEPKSENTKIAPPIVGGVLYDRSGSSPINKIPIPTSEELRKLCNLSTERDVYLFFGEIQSNSSQNMIRCYLPGYRLQAPTKPERSDYSSREFTRKKSEYESSYAKFKNDSVKYYCERDSISNVFVNRITDYFRNISSYSSYTDIFTAMDVSNTIYNEFEESENFLLLLSDGMNTNQSKDTTTFEHDVFTVLVNGAGISKTSIDNIVDARMESFDGSVRAIINKFNL